MALLVVMALGARADPPVRMLILSDTRDHNKVFKSVKASINEPISFILAPGDMDPLSKAREALDTYFGPKTPWYPVIGNHEVGDKGSMRYLHDSDPREVKVNPGPAGTEKTTYSFDYGNVHVALINVYWNGKDKPGSETQTDGDVVPALRKWLEADLKKSGKRWKLVVGHEPAFPQDDRDWKGTRHLGTSLDRHKENRDAFWRVLEETGVTAYICGHTHRYSRVQAAGGKVWQIDAAQLRGDASWKFDAFIVMTADDRSFKVETYRNLKEHGKFRVTDRFTIGGGRD